MIMISTHAFNWIHKNALYLKKCREKSWCLCSLKILARGANRKLGALHSPRPSYIKLCSKKQFQLFNPPPPPSLPPPKKSLPTYQIFFSHVALKTIFLALTLRKNIYVNIIFYWLLRKIYCAWYYNVCMYFFFFFRVWKCWDSHDFWSTDASWSQVCTNFILIAYILFSWSKSSKPLL